MKSHDEKRPRACRVSDTGLSRLTCLDVALWFLACCTVGPALAATDLARLAADCNAGKAKACQQLNDATYSGKDRSRNLAAIRLLRDESRLFHIAFDYHTFREAQMAATLMLTDQKGLLILAGEAREPEIRAAARARVTDQKFLAGVVAAPTNHNRELALSLLTDQALLGEFARNSSDPFAAVVAGKITDQGVLIRVALEGTTAGARQSAAVHIDDQVVLARIVQNDSDVEVAIAAFRALKNPPQSLLVEIATSKAPSQIREWAIGAITDQQILLTIYRGATDLSVKDAALAMIKDEAVLIQIPGFKTGLIAWDKLGPAKGTRSAEDGGRSYPIEITAWPEGVGYSGSILQVGRSVFLPIGCRFGHSGGWDAFGLRLKGAFEVTQKGMMPLKGSGWFE